MNAMRGGAKTGWTAGLCPEPHGIRTFWNLCDHAKHQCEGRLSLRLFCRLQNLAAYRHGAFWSSSSVSNSKPR